jgi:hypothetical protein
MANHTSFCMLILQKILAMWKTRKLSDEYAQTVYLYQHHDGAFAPRSESSPPSRVWLRPPMMNF